LREERTGAGPPSLSSGIASNTFSHFYPADPELLIFAIIIQLGKQYEPIHFVQQALIGPMTCTLASCRISASERHALVQKAFHLNAFWQEVLEVRLATD
jgi:hypothetical protein